MRQLDSIDGETAVLIGAPVRPPYTVIDFVADQLRASNPNPSADWNMEGVNRAEELARMLVAAGVRDLGLLGLQKIPVTSQAHPWAASTVEDQYTLLYDGKKRLGYIGEPNRAIIDTYLHKTNQGLTVAWSAEGHGNVSYTLIPRGRGFVIDVVWGSSSDAAQARTIIIVAASMVINFVLPGMGLALGNMIGAAVLGPALAASYPLLASAIGNIALSAAFNGGDMKRAVTGVALGMVGTAAGGFVGTFAANATGIESIGNVTAAVTRAYIAGSDIKVAGVTALLGGAGAISDTKTAKADAMPDFGTYGDYGASGDPYAPAVPDTGSGFVYPVFDVSFSADQFAPLPGVETVAPISVATVPGGATDFANLNVGAYDVPIEAPKPAATDPGVSIGDTRNLVNQVSGMALAALQVVKAFKAAKSGAVVTNARTVNADGSTVSALDNGIVQTRTADGRLINTRPPVGAAQSTVTGNVIVNNGDGTYTLIDGAGNRRVIQYASAAAGGGSALSDLNWPLIIGGAGVAIAAARLLKGH